MKKKASLHLITWNLQAYITQENDNNLDLTVN